MPRLKVFSGRELRTILEAHGFVYARHRGSHMIMVKTLPGDSITVSVPDHDEVRIGTLSSIIRSSGLPRELFEA
jgi:predicted RNA binding protein YcfA (HicA-like mRNA interferase family)